MQKRKERTLIGPAEAPLSRARSSRNGGRNHLGTPSEIKSECWATSSRIRGRLPPESADFYTVSYHLLHRHADDPSLWRYRICRICSLALDGGGPGWG